MRLQVQKSVRLTSLMLSRPLQSKHYRHSSSSFEVLKVLLQLQVVELLVVQVQKVQR
jgi:hypothetical protein